MADDTVLLASSSYGLQLRLERLVAECEAVGKRISTSTFETTVLSHPSLTTDCLNILDSSCSTADLLKVKFKILIMAFIFKKMQWEHSTHSQSNHEE